MLTSSQERLRRVDMGVFTLDGVSLRIFGEDLQSENYAIAEIPSNATPLTMQGCFIRQGMYFVNIIGDKYSGKSHELLTILMPKIECQLNALLIFHLLNP